MGRALYRKYRPKSLNEVVGQEHITKTLNQAIKQGRLSHAYLFTGPRGVGKTSVARILAHQINDLPYDDDSSPIDIIEIDAASNRRIDEIRELRDKVYVAPVSAKYKVYIIDEVHMLTREAFNALLKTLEEPPAHVVFILATTDAHKLPETIISRTQRFNFRPGEKTEMAKHLSSIAKAEDLKVSEVALSFIAEHGDGSFRDSISLLDQASSQAEKVEKSDIERLLGLPSSSAIEQLLILLNNGSTTSELMQALSDMYDQGYQAAAIAKQLGQSLRQQVAEGNPSRPREDVLDLLGQLVEVPASFSPERALEIALLKSLPDKAAYMVPVEHAVVTQKEIVSDAPQPIAVIADVVKKPEPVPTLPAKPNTPPSDRTFNSDLWPNILKELKQKHNTLYGVVRMAQPDFSEENKLRLAFAFNFHQKRLNETINRQKLIDIIYNLSGQAVELECIVDKAAEPPKITVAVDKPVKTSKPDDLAAISNIFGSAELLES